MHKGFHLELGEQSMRTKNRCADTPLVSVIMPVYNCELYVEAAIRSVMQQTYNNWVLLVIDDGSSDETYNVARNLAAEDQRISVIQNERNMGVARTRNRGLELSEGDYVALLDGDDVWHADKLEQQINLMLREKADFSYSSYAIVDATGVPRKRNYIVPEKMNFSDLLKENVIGCSTVVFSRDIAKSYKFATDFYHEDYCLWLDILRDGHTAIGCSATLVDWRWIANSRSFDKKRSAMNRWKIYREYLQLPFAKSLAAFVSYMFNGIKKYYGS